MIGVAINEMFCTKCGKELPDGQAFCDACGAQIEIPEQEVLANETPAETLNEPSSEAVEAPSAGVAEQPETETPAFANPAICAEYDNSQSISKEVFIGKPIPKSRFIPIRIGPMATFARFVDWHN